MKQRISIALAVVSTLFITSCRQAPRLQPTGLVAEKAMVVSARVEASRIGSQVLAQGGNAFDAMVATELALAVAYPFAGNIGGGGFMVYRKADGSTGAIDYREKAPLAAHKDMYLDSLGNVIPKMSTTGATAVGVPGTVAGVFAVHKKFGSIPMAQLIAPAIALAKRGVVVTAKQEKRLKRYREAIAAVSGDSTLLALPYKQGDTIVYGALATTLEQLQKHGKDGFYKGEIARKIASFIQDRGGFITEEDLAKYEAKWRTPIAFGYKDLKIISMCPPSSGGITIQQILGMIAPYPIASYGHNSTKSIQLIAEAERRAYADRNYYLGDPDFVAIPQAQLGDKGYLKERMASFSWEQATKSTDIGRGNVSIVESNETTHYSIVDAEGNAVSATTTINGGYGSKLYSEALGFFFNNEMDDFSSKPGVPNMFGLIGAEANSIAPEKRMLSSMTPTIVERNGKLYMVVGSPGGATIITSVVQTILNVYEFNLSMQEAVNAPRFHHQWLPDMVLFEETGFADTTIQELRDKGYKTSTDRTPILGKVDAILVLPDGRLEGGADKRGDDTAVGF